MSNFTISRLDENLAGKIEELAMASFSQSPIVAAVVTPSHHLKLIAWTVAPSGLLTRNGHHDGAQAQGIDCALLTEQTVIAAYQGQKLPRLVSQGPTSGPRMLPEVKSIEEVGE